MSNEKCYSPEELRQLAARVVDCIVSDDRLSDALIQLLEKNRSPECPPHTLCCSKNHVCEVRTSSFNCTAPFQCSNGHVEKLTQA